MTSYDVIIDMFFRRVEQDRKFFLYVGLSDDESMSLARERAIGYFEEAVGLLVLYGRPQAVDFSDRDDGAQAFNFDLTQTEKLLLSALMYQQYLQRDIAYLKTLSVNYTATDLRVFDPSNARSTFMAMYNTVVGECNSLLDMYRNTNRDDGSYLSINFGAYDSEA